MRRFLVPKATCVILTALLASVLWSPPTPAHATGVTAFGAGAVFTCGVTTGGGVECWGGTSEWTAANQLMPQPMFDASGQPLQGAVDVVGGWVGACALTSVGAVKCWGFPLGDGTWNVSRYAVDVFGLQSGITAISSGRQHVCAVTESSRLKCWGDNAHGQLGDGTTTARLAPVDATEIQFDVDAVAAGARHTCALTSAGGVRCWGGNSAGQLGDGTFTDSQTPRDVVDQNGAPLSGVVALAGAFAHNCAILATGALVCWGSAFSGQLGNGESGSGAASPYAVQVQGLSSGVERVSLGAGHSCAVLETGAVKCWGDNNYGQLGAPASQLCPSPVPSDPPWPCSSTPVDVQGLAGPAIDIKVGDGHSCAALSLGRIQCWGENDAGQLGNGTTTDSLVPVDVLFDSDHDGCFDVREQGADPRLGGARNPKSFWDFFDTPDGANVRDRLVSVSDVGRVVARFGTAGDPANDPLSPPPPSGYHTAFDRSPPAPGADVWDAGPPDGSVGTGDIGAVVAQFGHSCA